MDVLYTLELEPEVLRWLEALPLRHYLLVEEKATLLAEHPTTLGEPHSRHLGDGVRELRLNIDGSAYRVTYWFAPRRRIVLLTVFRKTKMREDAEVKRAKLAQQTCERLHHAAHETYSRDIAKELP